MTRGPFLVAASLIALAGALPPYPSGLMPRIAIEREPSGWPQWEANPWPTTGPWATVSEAKYRDALSAAQRVRWGDYGDPLADIARWRKWLMEGY